jgi:SnoaL-like protein
MDEAAIESSLRAFREAAERRDLEAILATLSSDVVVRSPVTDRLPVAGIEEARELFGVVFAELGELVYTDELSSGDVRMLVYRGRLAGEEIEEAQLLRFDAAGKICELTFFIRPLPALAGVAARFAPALARRRHGPLRALAMRFAGVALRLLIAFGDRVGSRILG